MVEITTRPLTAAEREQLQPQTRVRWLSLVLFVLLPTMAGGGVMATLLVRIVGQLGFGASLHGIWIGCLAALVLGALAAHAYYGSERQRTALASADLQTNQMEEILVMDADVVEIGMAAIDEPALVFHVDEGQLLLLQGTWLLFGATYGADAHVAPDELDPNIFNGHPAPYSFPNTCFVVTRHPVSKQIAGIRVEGEYLKPEMRTVKYADKHLAGLSACEIIPGTIASIEQSLGDAYEAVRNNT